MNTNTLNSPHFYKDCDLMKVFNELLKLKTQNSIHKQRAWAVGLSLIQNSILCRYLCSGG